MHNGKNGFTLVELMVTLSIAAILLTVAVPNFIIFLQNSRLASQSNDLATILNYARSEAVKGAQRVTVCSRATDTSCSGATNWDNGFLVFVDPNGNGTVDAGEVPLQVRQAMDGDNTLRSGRARITFQANGFSTGFNDTFRLCDARGTASARAIVISNQGRTRTNSLAAEGGACP